MIKSLDSIRYMLDLARGLAPRLIDVPAAETTTSLPPIKEDAARTVKPGAQNLTAAIELLTANPNATSSEVAAQLNLSQGYARTLIKRARLQLGMDAAAPVRSLRPVAAKSHLDEKVEDLRRSLEETRAQVRELAAGPAPIRRSLHLNNRAAILNMQRQGSGLDAIAQELDINLGEVEFIVKIDRFNSQAV